MIQLINNFINNIFKLLRATTLVIVTILYFILQPLYILMFTTLKKNKSFDEEPFFKLLMLYQLVYRFWDRFIF